MKGIRRVWTAEEADNWTKEDWITIVLSPLAYIFLMLGVGLSFLLLWYGFIILFVGIGLTIMMHWIINPKLKMISDTYEKKQKVYLQELEDRIRWEDENE